MLHSHLEKTNIIPEKSSGSIEAIRYDAQSVLDALDSNQIEKFPNGLRKMVALFGITKFSWREPVIQYLLKHGITCFDPTSGHYEKDINPGVENRVLHEAVVAGIRFEGSKEYKDIGLATMVEVGYSILSAILSGQKVVVSIDPSYKDSLESEYAKRMFDQLLSQLLNVQQLLQQDQIDNLTVLTGEKGDLGTFQRKLVEAYQEVEQNPQDHTAEIIERFAQRCVQRQSDDSFILVDGGASAAFSPALQPIMQAQKDAILNLRDSDDIISLYRSPYNVPWRAIEGEYVSKEEIEKYLSIVSVTQIHIDQNEKAAFAKLLDKEKLEFDDTNALRTLAARVETRIKASADTIFWAIQNASGGTAAVLETPFLFIRALLSGQTMIAYQEPFDMRIYIEHVLMQPDTFAKIQTSIEQLDTQSPQFKRAIKTYRALDQARQGNWELILDTKGQIRAELFENQETAEFQKVEGLFRIRGTAMHQLQGLKELYTKVLYEYGVELGLISTDLADLVQKVQLNPENRRQFLQNLLKFKTELSDQVKRRKDEAQASQPKERDAITVSIVRESLHRLNEYRFELMVSDLPVEQREAKKTALREKMHSIQSGLDGHLEKVRFFAQYLDKVILEQTGENFLTRGQFELIENIIAPLHDIVKLLDAFLPDAQVMPDHEILIGMILQEILPELGYPAGEVEFIVKIISDHENIFKEAMRHLFASSMDPIKRGQAHFFIVDTLTSGLTFSDGMLTISQKDVDDRFVDLYYRHMDKEAIRKKKLPEPRPEWGLYTLTDWFAYFDALSAKGLRIDPQMKVRLTNSAIKAIDLALSDDQAKVNALLPDTVYFTSSEKAHILTVRAKILDMQQAAKQKSILD